MSDTLTMPFAIGQTFYLPVNGSTRVQIPCPVCAGSLAVTVILGSGEKVGVPCDACGLGLSGPRGFIHEYQQTPGVVPFTIDRVLGFRGDEWTVASTDGAEVYFAHLFTSEADALAESERLVAEHHERNMRTRQHTRSTVQRTTWSVRYHREQIAELERQILWHKAKVRSKGGAA